MKEIIKKNNKVALIGTWIIISLIGYSEITTLMYLFLYSNETFLPQSDTNFLKWKRFIHDWNLKWKTRYIIF